MKNLSIVSPCYNESENVEELYERIVIVCEKLQNIRLYEIILIDNASSDNTVAKLKELARHDPRVKVIVNVRNFGHIRSPHHALLQASGDVVVILASDLQDPPEMIPQLLDKWHEGFKIVAAVKSKSEDTFLMGLARQFFYFLLDRIAGQRIIKNFTGFGVYDKEVIEALKKIDDPYPYFRGLISELGWTPALITFDKPARKRGFTKNNFFTLYDMAILGIVKLSMVPIRLATLIGFLMGVLSFSSAIGVFILKMMFWDSFSLGIAPFMIGFFFFSSIQLIFIGLIGEYVASIHTLVRKLPLVVEKERVNF
jgi:glycosyltransferase involved in cell wall biosynthesis